MTRSGSSNHNAQCLPLGWNLRLKRHTNLYSWKIQVFVECWWRKPTPCWIIKPLHVLGGDIYLFQTSVKDIHKHNTPKKKRTTPVDSAYVCRCPGEAVDWRPKKWIHMDGNWTSRSYLFSESTKSRKLKSILDNVSLRSMSMERIQWTLLCLYTLW